MPPAVAAAAIIGGATVAGAAISSHAASSAANAQKDAAASNNALQSQIYDSNKQILSPYASTGSAANDYISALLGIGSGQGGGGGSSAPLQPPTQGAATSGAQDTSAAADAAFQRFLHSTGYQFQLDQANKNVIANESALGLRQSGPAMKAIADRAQQMGGSYFDTFLNQVSSVANRGLSAGSALAGVGQNYANATSANNNNAADASSNASLAQGTIWGNALSSLAGQAGQLFSSSYKKSAAPNYFSGGTSI